MGRFFLIVLDLTEYFQHSLKIIFVGFQHSEALPNDGVIGVTRAFLYNSDLLKCTSTFWNSLLISFFIQSFFFPHAFLTARLCLVAGPV